MNSTFCSFLNRPKLTKTQTIPNFGDLLGSVEEGHQIFIQSNLVNNIENPLQFAYLVQIKDENDDVINLSWMVGSIQPQQSMDVKSIMDTDPKRKL